MLHGCFLTQLTLQQILLCPLAAAATLGETTHPGLLVMESNILKIRNTFVDIENESFKTGDKENVTSSLTT